MLLRKMDEYRDEDYLAWIRLQPCILCESTPSEAHHEPLGGDKGTSIKPPDYQALPLCSRHNREREAVPKSEFWAGYDPPRLIVEHIMEYLRLMRKEKPAQEKEIEQLKFLVRKYAFDAYHQLNLVLNEHGMSLSVLDLDRPSADGSIS